jgi:DNA-binding transcriptional MerR regulator/methylmalonyl-CoA mutase cobalamin-binding subunit
MSPDSVLNDQFPIRVVSELTGVNAVTLRAWERRYGLIKPVRTPKGHRLYTQKDVELINNILDRLSRGLSISQIARDILHKTTDEQSENTDAWHQYQQRMIDAVVRFDEHSLDTVYNDAMSLYPVDVVTSRLIMPVLEQLGMRWQTESGSIAEEHFFSVYLRNKLGARFHHQNLKNTGPKLIMACLPGEHHEFGILLFALTALSRGMQVILLGADLPVTELQHVAERTNSNGVVLSGSASLDCRELIGELESFCGSVSIPVFVGGEVASSCEQVIVNAQATPLSKDLTQALAIVSTTLRHKTQ